MVLFVLVDEDIWMFERQGVGAVVDKQDCVF